jgi:hypothetical protein
MDKLNKNFIALSLKTFKNKLENNIRIAKGVIL